MATEGSAFDAEGRMRDWWTPADYARACENLVKETQ